MAKNSRPSEPFPVSSATSMWTQLNTQTRFGRGGENVSAVGFTATREGLRSNQLRKLREILTDLRAIHDTFRHGDCVGGDESGHHLAVELGYRVVIHPPANPKLRAFMVADETLEPLPYLERNRVIVDNSAFVIGCPNGEEQFRSGTWSTIRYSRKTPFDRRTIVIMPNGDLA